MTRKYEIAKQIYRGRIFDVRLEAHRLPNGRQATFEIVRHPGGAAILPVLDDGRVLLIKQYRPAVSAMVYEIPAGRLEVGESPRDCALRELEEETGYSASRISPLGGFFAAVGYCDEYIELFLASGLVQAEQNLEPDEVVELSPMSFDQAMHKLSVGTITDCKTQVALLRYQQQLSDEERR
ncbi:MAG: NUDIX hydrolase [Deltaproteobacteria bacterium]|jgi:ADP-ribose pyrophosphatase|nr:NUDIX hydrolase [Deltaproteobacteria bacterium]